MNRRAISHLGGIHYAWIVFAVTFITLLAASGTRSTPAVLMVPLEAEFGWSRATISLAVSINLVLFGFVGPFAAAMMERWGIRPVVAGALLFIAAGAALTSLMTVPWQLYLLWGIVVGLGAGTMATVFAATVANRWFVQRRGLVVGLLTAASATGQLIFLPFLGWLAQERGWRYVSLTVALCTLAVVPLVLVFLRNRPEDAGVRAYGASEDDPPAPPRGNPVAIAFRGLAIASGNRNFWLLAATFFICGASTNGLIGTHLIPASVDHGMAEVTAASLLAVVGIFDVVGTTVSGVLTDRVDSRKLLFAYYGLRGLSLLFLPLVLGSPSFGLILFIVFYGLDWVATVPPTVAIASQTFGRAAGPVVYGWVFTAHQLGAAVVASAAGVIRTVTGGYELAFVGSALLCLLAAGLCLLMRRAGETETTTPLLPNAPLVRSAGT
ncbi:MAG TPA: MFS transporter [Thermomicrobiales bacterium]|nr:MFS transporter [Thermomicrobiales bacterium]